MCSANVLHLEPHRQTNGRHPDGARLGALSKRFSALMPVLLDAFFSGADDFLFRLAEQSSSGFEANDYFDQLRALRLQKGPIAESIRVEVERWLRAYAKAPKGSPVESRKAVASLTAFSLMDDGVLEQTLATDSFANRTLDRAGDHWLAFHERMAVLTCNGGLVDADTPFHPKGLGSLVFSELGRLSAPFKTTLMLFRLFDELAIPRLIEFYETSNDWLVAEGVLPEFSLIPAHKSGQGSTHTAQRIEQLSAALASQIGYTPNAAGRNRAGPSLSTGMAAGFDAQPGGILVDAGLLQQMLSTLAQSQMHAAPSGHRLDELKQWTAEQASKVNAQAQGTQEAGTVSLVALLFEYILDDDNLSAHMKQLLARMQIPIIKVALLNKDFFTNTEHSARLLLNRMARSANGWRPDANIANDGLLDGMEKIVIRLNHEFDQDLSIFDLLLEEFTELSRTYDAGQAAQIVALKATEEQAYTEHQNQDRARLFMTALLAKEQLPAALHALLNDQWCQLMQAIYHKQGASKAWHTSARIARELVWTLQPSVQFSHAARFTVVVPKLLEGVRSGLRNAGLDESDINRAVAEIENHHGLYAKPVDEHIWTAQEKLDRFEGQAEIATALMDQPLPLLIDEPVAQIKNADLSYYMDQVESLTLDQWFEIELNDGSIERGCLSFIVGAGSKFVFTNYLGHKIAERSAIGLAMSLLNDQFRPIAVDPLFDRMIDSLIDDLGQKETVK
ncbi:DUF1631 family protein [Reinekea sp.]|jgi:hypothetical protein|uniref:DUF1631 family protein n=1 Tax=Reinekea sp. TaxID=1970455 RepID=UPI002A81C4D8|nr:DUF1631 family protein [Reinekea sp.]